MKINNFLLAAFIINAILILVCFGLFCGFFGSLDQLLVVHFDIYRGIDFLGDKGDFLGILITASAITVINFLIFKIFYKHEDFIAYLLAFFNIFFLILILIAIAVIIAVN